MVFIVRRDVIAFNMFIDFVTFLLGTCTTVFNSDIGWVLVDYCYKILVNYC